MFDLSPARTAPPLQQSKEYCAALAAFGRDVRVLPSGDRAILRKGPLGLPLTMLARTCPDPMSLRDDLTAIDRCRGLVILHPDRPAPDLANLGALAIVTPIHVAELDLTGDLRAALRQKWRNRLNRAERHGLRVKRMPMPQDPGHWLLQADAAQQAGRGYRNWPSGLTLAYARATPGTVQVFAAYDGATRVAGLAILRHGNAATYHIGHTSARGRQLSAHNGLMFAAMDWLQRTGAVRLDLGLISTEDQPGLARFKIGTGARLRPLGGTWLWAPRLGRALTPFSALDAHAMQARPAD